LAATVQHLAPNLYLIVLSPSIRGFQDFIGAWLVKGPDATYLVDVGPAATALQLTGALTELGVRHLDYICLTHIHMDHAGAVGHLADRYPEATVVCHPKGVAHIVDPERLWQGTVKTLGDTGRAYGRMLPVNPSRIADERRLTAAPFDLLDTPGHSPHHFAVAAESFLFVGEAGGVCLPLPSGDTYLRPATPPRFFLEVSLSSLDRLIAANPRSVCYGHFGWQKQGQRMLASHRDQLLLWKEVLSAESVREEQPSTRTLDGWVDLLLATDPRLQGFSSLASEVQDRERGFLLNSVRGFAEYLASRDEGRPE